MREGVMCMRKNSSTSLGHNYDLFLVYDIVVMFNSYVICSCHTDVRTYMYMI